VNGRFIRPEIRLHALAVNAGPFPVFDFDGFDVLYLYHHDTFVGYQYDEIRFVIGVITLFHLKEEAP